MTKSVLYVDDEEPLLEISKIFLERAGDFSVDTVCSAADGLERIRTSSYSAVVSDYEMPGMDGIAFLKEIRRQYPDLPFIIFTGKGREDVVIEALNSGASYYLQKGGDPVSQFAELSHKIMLAVEKREVEEQLRLDEQRLEALVEFHENSGMPFPDFMDYAIEEVTRISGSRYGFIALVEESEDHLSMYGWSQQALKDSRMPPINKEFALHETGLWADAIRKRCPVIINDFATTSHGCPQVPEGHVPLTRYLGVPLIDNGRVVLLAGVGNKVTPYDEADVRQITLLMSSLWKIVRQKRAEKELVGAYERIEESKNRLQGQIDHMFTPPPEMPDTVLTDFMSTEYLQNVQDVFADTCNVVSLITDMNGVPLTRLSNGCEVCTIICGTDTGAAKCGMSGWIFREEGSKRMNHPCAACLGMGFVIGSAPICVGGRHIADWHIGQIQPTAVTAESVAEYARESGADEEVLLAAFKRIEVMPPSQFEKTHRLLRVGAHSISDVLYANVCMAKNIL